jgi:hypothetical protein
MWNFMEALAAMQNGSAVMRDSWTMMDGYRMVFPGTKHVYQVVNAHLQPNILWASLSLDDLNATDWRLVQVEDVTPPSDVLPEVTPAVAA